MMPAGEAGADDDDDYDNMSGNLRYGNTDPKMTPYVRVYAHCIKEINKAVGLDKRSTIYCCWEIVVIL